MFLNLEKQHIIRGGLFLSRSRITTDCPSFRSVVARMRLYFPHCFRGRLCRGLA